MSIKIIFIYNTLNYDLFSVHILYLHSSTKIPFINITIILLNNIPFGVSVTHSVRKEVI